MKGLHQNIPSVHNAIHLWALAQREAAQNTDIMLHYHSSWSEICHRRMSALYALEHVLDVFRDRKGMPTEAVRWWRASDNLPKCGCLLQSNAQKQHPECVVAMEEYCASRQALMEYGLALKYEPYPPSFPEREEV